MCESNIPSFSTYIYLAVFVLGFLSASFIFFKDRKNPININISIFLFILSLWTANDFWEWQVSDLNLDLMIDRISILVCFTVLFFLYFSYYFTHIEIDRKKKVLFAIPFIPVLAFIFTDYNVFIIDSSKCIFGQGILNWYVYILSIAYVMCAVAILFKSYRNPIIPLQTKFQIRVLMFAIIFLVLWFIFFIELRNISILRNSLVETLPFILIGILFFISLIVFSIVEYGLFEFNRVPTRAFVLVLWTILISILFFVETGTAFSIITFILYSLLILFFWVF